MSNTILLAIWDDDQRDAITRELEADAHEPLATSSHGEAVLTAQGQNIELIVADLALPGYAALRLIREIRAGVHAGVSATVPVLALLGDLAGEMELVRAFDAGADDVARQPVA